MLVLTWDLKKFRSDLKLNRYAYTEQTYKNLYWENCVNLSAYYAI